MSMHEAIRKIRGVASWLTPPEPEAEHEAPPTALEIAESVLFLAKTPGHIDRVSPTYRGIASWAANELLAAQVGLETATGDKAAELRARCRTLRDVLTVGARTESKAVIEDQEPIIP